jgi:ATP-dependent Zn protease
MRPPVWIVGLVLIALAVFAVIELAGGPGAISYGEFLDQLEAGNVASVTFQGTRIDGRFKQPATESQAGSATPLTVFHTQGPDFGDPTLLPELRREQVQIGVASSQWLGAGTAALLGIIGAVLLAKPMLLVIAAAFIAGLIRVMRGGKMNVQSILAIMPMFKSSRERSGSQNDTAAELPEIGTGSPPRKNEVPDVIHHHTRPWYLRPPVWAAGAVLLGLAAFGVMQVASRPPTISYGDFLDHLDTGNVARVTFSGTSIDGDFKRPVGPVTAKETASQTAFHSQVPDFGDPTLLEQLRKEHVAIDVVASSGWLAWLGRLPWPMVVFLVVILIAGLVRMRRGGKAQSDTPMPMHPMQGMLGLLAGLSSKGHSESQPQQRGDPKNG